MTPIRAALPAVMLAAALHAPTAVAQEDRDAPAGPAASTAEQDAAAERRERRRARRTIRLEEAVGKDIEDRDGGIEEQVGKLDTKVFFETEWHEFADLDFRRLDESSDQAILDSDDRGSFAFTGVALDLGYQVDKSTRFVMGASYRGLWGNDQIGLASRFGGFFYFTALYVEYAPTIGNYKPVIRLGRQRFDIGGMGGAREFILGDVVDMLRVDLPVPGIGRFILIPINVVGMSLENDDVTFVNFVGQAFTQSFGFRGDRMTRRHGGIFVVNPDKLPDLDVRAYGFYTDIGALGSGSDITYNGRLGNFADNDWVANFGLRAAYTIKDLVTPYASFDGSAGIDRKEVVTNDVNTNGFAWSAGVIVRKDKEKPRDFGIFGEVSYFEAQGPVYRANGQLDSHGYVGMKARQVGGLLANRFLGWHPTAYVGTFGVEDTSQETDRKTGTRVVSAQFNMSPRGPVSFGAGYWFLQDTGRSFVDQATVDQLQAPFGYSREEYEAQARLGRVLGHEVNANVGVALSRNLSFFAQGGVLVPGAYYALPIARIAGTALGSDDPVPFWDFSAGANVSF